MVKATEIRLSVPTAAAAKATVSARPSHSVSSIGTISRHDRTASTSHSVISTRLAMVPIAMPRATVPNSSSVSATLPVMRTRALPSRTSGSCAIAARMACVAASPGAKEAKLSFTFASTNRYRPALAPRSPVSNSCHDKGCGCPEAAVASDFSKPRIGPANAARSASLRWTPVASRSRAANSPRALGSATSWPRKGCASMMRLSRSSSSLLSRNISPLRAR